MAVRPYSGQHVGHQMSTGLGRAFGGFHRTGKVRGIYSHMQGRPEHGVSDMRSGLMQSRGRRRSAWCGSRI